MTDLVTALTAVTDAVAAVGVPVRAVGDVTTVGHGEALIVRPPSTVDQTTGRVWSLEVGVLVLPTSQLDVAGLVTLAQSTLNALGDAGLRANAQPATVDTADGRLTVYDITVEV